MRKYIKYLLLLLPLALGIGTYQYFKPHQDLSSVSTDFKMKASELFTVYVEDEALANAKYLDKVIEVSGTIREFSTNKEGIRSVYLESGDLLFGISCELDPLTSAPKNKIKTGEAITIKGICTGMLTDVVLVRCVIL